MTDRGDTERSAAPVSGIGHRRPPVSSRFKPGHSGNPRGRPRGSGRKLPYDAVLGQKVEIRLDGQPRRVTAAEALLLKLVQSGVAGDARIGELVLTILEAEREVRSTAEQSRDMTIVCSFVSADDPSSAMLALGMAVKLDRFRPTARILLEPWLVEAALARPGADRLDTEAQRTVFQATRTPAKVRWPEWWTER